MTPRINDIWEADPQDATTVARLLHDFNREFDTPTPSVTVLATRLETLLATPSTFAILAGRPAVGVALVTLRNNVWYSGAVALLDELYVQADYRDQGIGSAIMAHFFRAAEERRVDLIEINVDEGDFDAQRFYARHGFQSGDAGTDGRSLYFWKEDHSPEEAAPAGNS